MFYGYSDGSQFSNSMVDADPAGNSRMEEQG
jgi:hypothetical protein